MIRALLFDLDGLLTDTEPLHMESYQICFGEVGVEISDEFYIEHWIRHGLNVNAFCALHALPHDPATMRERKKEIYHRLVRERARLMPGARALLERVHGRFALALVTSAYRESAAEVLDATGIDRYFSVVVTGNDVMQQKPDPSCFLRAAERLGVDRSECVVLEDAEKGIVAAHRAGMISIAVPQPLTATNDFSMATHIVGSLDEITDSVLLRIAHQSGSV